MDIEELPIENMGTHWGKRVGAIIIDFILIGILTYAIFWAFGLFSFNLYWLLTLWALVMGIIFVIYAGALEGGIGASVGKGIVGLEVVAINEELTVGKGFARNISKIWWLILLADTGAGLATAGDPRQKQLDKAANTIVIQALPVAEVAPRMPYIAPLPSKDEGDRSEWEIPEELLSGNCSLCGTPYKILPPEDKKSWSGLWNSRCIWCNKLVFEDLKRRKEPDTWKSPRPETWRSPYPTWRSSYPAWR